VPDTAAPQVVHDAARETERPAGFRPEFPEIPDAAAVAVEDVRTIESPGLPATRDDRGEFAAVDREDAAVPVLAALWPEPYDALGPVVVAPLEASHLTNAPRREEQEADDVAEDVRQAVGERLHLLAGEEAAAHARLVRG